MLIVAEVTDPAAAHQFLAALIDWPGDVWLADATTDGLDRDQCRPVRIHRRRPPMLLGAAGAWNLGLRARSYPWVLLTQPSVRISQPRTLWRELMGRNDTGDGLVCLGVGCRAVRADTALRVGLCDENLWPGPGVGADYDRRVQLCDYTWEGPVPCAWTPGSMDEAVSRYYRAKWGGLPGAERHGSPFGEDRPLGYWPHGNMARTWMDRTGRDHRALSSPSSYPGVQ